MKKQVGIKTGIIYIAIMMVVMFTFVLGGMNWTTNIKNIPTTYLRATYAIDYDNMEAVVGDADYVFVGTITNEKNTVYKNAVEIEDENGVIVEVSSPYTNYEVDVVKNIKGNLTTEETVQLQKSGGISKDRTEYVLYEEDRLPVVGGTYIFFAYAQPNGSLLLSGPVSNLKLNVENIGDFESTAEYKEIMEAYENQEQFDRQRYTSVYEI